MSNTQPSSALEKRAAQLNDHIATHEKILQEALPEGMSVRQILRDAYQVVQKTPKLATCHWASVVGGLVTSAQLGLRVGVSGLGHAYLIPMWNNRDQRTDATLIIGYKGYVELGYRHPEVASVLADCVYANDTFDIVRRGGAEDMEHRFAKGERGLPIKYYAILRLRNGGFVVTRPWTQDEMNEHRDKYALAKNKKGEIVGPWAPGKGGRITSEGVEMGKKTMIRVPLVKSMPLTWQMAAAVSIDEGGVRTEIDPTADPAAVTDHPNRPDTTPAEGTDPGASVRESINLNGAANRGKVGEPGMVTVEQDRQIGLLMRDRGMNKDAALDLVEKTIGERKSARLLTFDQANQVIEAIGKIDIPTLEGVAHAPGQSPAVEPYDRRARERRMFALLKEQQVTGHGDADADRRARIAFYQAVIGRQDIGSTNDLADAELEKLIEAMEADPLPADDAAAPTPAAPAPAPARAAGAEPVAGDELEAKIRAEWPGTKTQLAKTFHQATKTNLADADEAQLDDFLRRMRAGEFTTS
ncbi:recombinase RecT [Sphaerisporangium sp. NPDC004334]